jgi:hypothetical protein
VNQNLEDFQSWQDMFGPKEFNGDQFTSLLRYNLSDPQLTSNPQTGIGITITGYGSRSNIQEAPFDKDNIIIVSSTCRNGQLLRLFTSRGLIAVGGLGSSNKAYGHKSKVWQHTTGA